MKPLGRISIIWTSDLAYIVGLIASDGNLSKDGRHMTFVSKDLQLIKTFKKCLGLGVKIGKKQSGYSPNSSAHFLQFGDKIFYNFLLKIGLTPAKSKTIGNLDIPKKYFFDFLRGSFDGDGSFYSYCDKRWASSFLFYLNFMSASSNHCLWIQKTIYSLIDVQGKIKKQPHVYDVRYAKTEARKIIKNMYHAPDLPMLERKFKKICVAIKIDDNHNKRARVT